jgi:hypothetical protein
MAADPSFASTPRLEVNDVSTANTNRDGTGTIETILTAGSSGGTLVTQITVQSTGDPADGIVTIFLHDGTTAWLFDEIDHDNPAAASTTVAGYRTTRTYTNLVLPSGWSVRAACTVALTAGAYNVFVHGADL